MQIIVRLARAAAASGLLIAMLAGIPYALTVYVGWPLPEHVPNGGDLVTVATTPLTDEAIIDVLACVVWAAWTIFTVSAAAELVTEITGRVLPRLPGTGWARIVTGALIAAITTTTSSAVADTVPSHPVHHISTHDISTNRSANTQRAHHQQRGQTWRQPETPATGRERVQQPVTPTAAQSPARPTTHQVRPGETLWAIAAHHLGPHASPSAIIQLVRAIHAANPDHVTDPDHIEPGWKLTIPSARPGTPPDQEQPHPPNGHDRHHPPSPRPTPRTIQSPTRPPRTPPTTTRQTPPAPHPDDHGGHSDQTPRGGFTRLPSGALLGAALAAAVAGAIAIAAARRRAAYTPRRPTPARGRHARASSPSHSPALRRLLKLHHRVRRATARTAPHTELAGQGDGAGQSSDIEMAPVSMWAGAVAPAHIETGARNGRPVTIDLLDYGGLAVDGNGAPGCLRGLVAALVGRSGDGVNIVINDARGRVFSPDLTNVRRAAAWSDGAAELEATMLSRARLLAEHDDPATSTTTSCASSGATLTANGDHRRDEQGPLDYRRYRQLHPDDPLPLMCLITVDPPAEAAARLAALARSGPRHGVLVLATGTVDALTLAGLPMLQVAGDGRVNDAAPPELAEQLRGTRMQCLTEAETREILSILDDAAYPPARPAAHAGALPPHAALTIADPGHAGSGEHAIPDAGASALGGTLPGTGTRAGRNQHRPPPAPTPQPSIRQPTADQPTGQDTAGQDAGQGTGRSTGNRASTQRAVPHRAETSGNGPGHSRGRHRATHPARPPARETPPPPVQPTSAQSPPAPTPPVARTSAPPTPARDDAPTAVSAPTGPAELHPPGHTTARADTDTDTRARTDARTSVRTSDGGPGSAVAPAGSSREGIAARRRIADFSPAKQGPARTVPASTPKPTPDQPAQITGAYVNDVPGHAVSGHAVPPAPAEPPQEGARASNGPAVWVRVLGPVQVMVAGEPIRTGLRSASRELLAYLALRPDGATIEQIADAMWPDAEITKARRRFWTALGSLRSQLRGPAGDPGLQVIGHHADRYTILGTECRCDVWQFEEALERAAAVADREDDHSAEITALTDAITAYTGAFADGSDYLWAEPDREDLHRRALDTHVRLAELHAALDRTRRAITILEAAIRLDPLAEDLYTRLMRLHHRAGQADHARRVFGMLRERLADLDLTPSPASVAVLQMINEQLHRDSRRASPTDATDPTGLPPVT